MARTEHERTATTAQEANRQFDERFRPDERRREDVAGRAWTFAGIGFSRGHSDMDPETREPKNDHFELAIPFWMLAAIFGVWPLVGSLQEAMGEPTSRVPVIIDEFVREDHRNGH